MYGTFRSKECDKESSKKYEKLLFEDNSYEKIPKNIKWEFDYTSQKPRFYSGLESDLTENEIYELIEYKKIGLITTIKKCILFFTICSIIDTVGIALLYLFYLIPMIF